jgi:hypothetical protein
LVSLRGHPRSKVRTIHECSRQAAHPYALPSGIKMPDYDSCGVCQDAM